jgi:hypothetical protein
MRFNVGNSTESVHMAMPKIGSRKIVVDGISYHWRIRRYAITKTRDEGAPLTIVVEKESARGRVLVVALPQKRNVGWGYLYDFDQTPVTPRQVALAIRRAIQAGWIPEAERKPFQSTLVDELPILEVDSSRIWRRR